jgi:putative zinc finger/helix-turn-helix YgiT family protein
MTKAALSGEADRDDGGRGLSFGDTARGGHSLEEPMNCLECGTTITTRRESFDYDASGLPVTLADVEVNRCPRCEAFEVVIPRIEDLHRAIALEVIRQRSRLTPAEIRYLRTFLGWTEADLSHHMGVDESLVSHWESGEQPPGPVADRLLRLLVARSEPESDYPLSQLIGVTQEESQPHRLGLRVDAQGWQPGV